MCSLVSLPASIDGCPVSLSRRFRNTNRSLMKCLQKVTGWRRWKGREPTTEKEGGEGVKERETERSEGKSITQIQLSEALRS